MWSSSLELRDLVHGGVENPLDAFAVGSAGYRHHALREAIQQRTKIVLGAYSCAGAFLDQGQRSSSFCKQPQPGGGALIALRPARLASRHKSFVDQRLERRVYGARGGPVPGTE
jgi:hypothetical protein